MAGCKVDIFKRRLDKYMSTIQDEPQVLTYTAQRRAGSNSILDMGKFLNAHWPLEVEVFGDADSPSRRISSKNNVFTLLLIQHIFNLLDPGFLGDYIAFQEMGQYNAQLHE